MVVFHDDVLDRTTNGKGKLSDYTFDELQKLDAGNGERIPLLVDVLTIFEHHGKKLFIEYKEPDCESQCLQIVNDLKMIESVNMISFHLDILKKIRSLDQTVQLGLLMRDSKGIQSICDDLVKINVSNIGIGFPSLTKDVVEIVKSAGIQVWTWNPRDESQVHQALNCGIIGMGSDNIKMTEHAFSTFKK
jgi:glycerophosphoryl diester phosphodiesterase